MYQKYASNPLGGFINYSRLSMLLLRSSFCDSLFQCLHIGEKTLVRSHNACQKPMKESCMTLSRQRWRIEELYASTSNVCFSISSHCGWSVCLPFVFSFAAVYKQILLSSFSNQFGLLQQLPFQIAGTIFIKEGEPTRWILCSGTLKSSGCKKNGWWILKVCTITTNQKSHLSIFGDARSSSKSTP